MIILRLGHYIELRKDDTYKIDANCAVKIAINSYP